MVLFVFPLFFFWGGGVIIKGFIFVNDGQTLTVLHHIHTDEV